jgi:NAD(P)-dependent dehydrogenase (short-subunit alcohol dehydrogenase family)
MAQQIPFGFTSTASEVLAGVDLSGKTMIVTGGASGIGIETVKSLAAAGASVTIAARRVDAAEEVAKGLRAETGNSKIEVRPLDVADLNSVKKFADDWDKPIHALVNNAGIMMVPELERTAEGCELQFGTNFLGHFALTMGLRRQLAAASGARVVSVSSTGSLFGPVIWDDPHFHFTQYNPLLGYAQSKTACILLSVGIKERWAFDGIVSNASIREPSRQTSSDTPAASRRPSIFARTLSKAPRHPSCSPPRRLSRASTVDISTTARRPL